MIPYNICESKWISKAKKAVKNNYNEYHPIYELFVGISLVIIFVLTTLTLLSSFL
jgi:ATP/ADP translocase